MSHEIRTPMNGILGFTALLKEPKLTGDEQQQYISVIEKSGNRMLNIINNIVSISQIESGQVNLSYKETSVKSQMESLYHDFKIEAEKKY
jgi:signal transduction histidine kinase